MLRGDDSTRVSVRCFNVVVLSLVVSAVCLTDFPGYLGNTSCGVLLHKWVRALTVRTELLMFIFKIMNIKLRPVQSQVLTPHD